MKDPVTELIHRAAWMYYQRGMKQGDIANSLGLSRATVVNYLKRARAAGMVNISLTTELFSQSTLARELEDQFGLSMVWVVDEAVPGPKFPEAAASVMLHMLDNDQQVATAWGQTVYDMVDHMPNADLSGVGVLQMCGNTASAPYGYHPEQCTIEMARRLNADASNLFSPLVLSTPELARQMRKEKIVAEQLDTLSRCDLAILSVGLCGDNAHIVQCGALDMKKLKVYRRQGATGIVAGRILDAQGKELTCDYNDRLVAISLKSLKKIDNRLFIVDTKQKKDALLSAIRGKLVTHLVITATLARSLTAH